MIDEKKKKKKKNEDDLDVLIELKMRSMRYWVRFKFIKKKIYEIEYLMVFLENVEFCL